MLTWYEVTIPNSGSKYSYRFKYDATPRDPYTSRELLMAHVTQACHDLTDYFAKSHTDPWQIILSQGNNIDSHSHWYRTRSVQELDLIQATITNSVMWIDWVERLLLTSNLPPLPETNEILDFIQEGSETS